jgi:hypothetical protein
VQIGRIPGASDSVVVSSVETGDEFHVGVLEDGSQAGLIGPSCGVGIGVLDAMDVDGGDGSLASTNRCRTLDGIQRALARGNPVLDKYLHKYL